MSTFPARRRTAVIAFAATIVVVAIVSLLVLGGPGDDRPATPPKVVTIDGADHDTKRDDKLTLSPAARELVAAAEKAPDDYDVGGNLRGPDPTKASVIRGPLASQEWPGCKTAFVRSFSQRTSPIRAIALHYTAGGNLPGWADVDGLTAFSNNTANQVSWHFSIDREGHCAYNVPITQKAWTISSLNSQTVNIEVVGTGHDVDYAGAGFAKVAAVVQRIASIEHLPLRMGATDGHCNVTRPGIITHWMGGPCSGGHVDIKPYDIAGVVSQIAATANAATVPTGRASLTKAQRELVDNLAKQRAKGRRPNRRGGHWKGHPRAHAAARQRIAAIEKAIAYYRAHPKTQRQLRAARVAYLKKVLAS